MQFVNPTKSIKSRTPFVLLALGFGCLSLVSCQSSHRSARRGERDTSRSWPKAAEIRKERELAPIHAVVPTIAEAEFVNDDELCMTCHQEYVKTFQHNVHRGESCEKCHGPGSKHLISRGKEPGTILSFKKLAPAERSELCLKCHEKNACEPGALWRTSVHAHKGVSCTDCHTSHYNVPPGTPATTEPMVQREDRPRIKLASMLQPGEEEEEPVDMESIRAFSRNLGAVAPDLCMRCHQNMHTYQEIAGPHQICGANGFNCTTCHDPHGRIVERSRTELCLECHKKHSPTMAWHSSIHSQYGVACTDCHNPHPDTSVQRVVSIEHTDVRRPKRRPMAVQEPEACYKCHPRIFAKTRLPSHHPIREGKMTCSHCHDPHGQLAGNLKAETLNLVCYKCHAEKQGPFVYEHPPVTEDCSYCHEPHGTVANNLLHQPTTILCLRCHSGHRERHGGQSIDFPQNQIGFYTDCTRCHTQIHGSDLHGTRRSVDLMR